jgi:formamidopyrimidine-DNA glycosylase
MPELPEVQTTVNGINKVLSAKGGLKITDVWSDYFKNTTSTRTDNIKNKRFFEKFKKELVGEKFINAERKGKNILIHFSNNKTVLIHMKMTGHLLYGPYEWKKDAWISEEKNLKDPYNQFIHLVFSLSNGNHLVFSDVRKFAKVTLFETHKLSELDDLKVLGPEANDKNLDWKKLKQQLLRRPNWKIKTALMDQSIVAGIGNIYSDEILWASSIHPERLVKNISNTEYKVMLKNFGKILAHSIKLGGDSMSDYRNIYGERGGYQKSHKVYRRAKEKCLRLGCRGVIERKVIGGRSAHFCNTHQK